MMDLEELLSQARMLPAGRQKVSLLEEIVRHLDSSGDVQGAFEQRLLLIETAMSAGLHERSLVAFVNYLHHFDKSPELEDHCFDMLWAYFGIVWFTVDEPAIPMPRVEAMLSDLSRRFRELDLNSRPVDHLRWRIYMATGRMEEAQQLCERWKKGRSTQLCYDEACLIDSVVELYFRCGRFQDAIEAAKPIFERNLRSGPVPALTYCNVMLAHLVLGETELAAEYSGKLRRILTPKRSLGNLYEVSFLFAYYLNRRALDKALRLFTKYVRWTGETTDKDNISLFHNASAAMFDLLANDGKESIVLKIPECLPWYREDEKYSPRELSVQIGNWVDAMCSTFDARNENSVYSDRLRFFRNLSLAAADET